METELLLINLYGPVIRDVEVSDRTQLPEGFVDFLFEYTCVNGIRTVGLYEQELPNPREDLNRLLFNYEQQPHVENIGFSDWFDAIVPVRSYNIRDGEEDFVPRAGMPKNFLEIINRYSIDPRKTFIIGSNERDKRGAQRCDSIYCDDIDSFMNIRIP